jgi:two-component system NtrC family sensor kinase
MRSLRNIPIKRKLTIITMLTSSVALLLASCAFVTYEQIAFRRSMALDLSILTDMFDDNVAPGLTFNDARSIELALNSLSAHPHILGAAVYDKNGRVVAKYTRAGGARQSDIPPAGETGTRFHAHRLDAFRQIVLEGENIGTIYIASDLRELSARLQRYVFIVGAVLLLSLLVAFACSARLQHLISGPVSHLARIAGLVAKERNYSVRAPKQGDDELGGLVDAFNGMLEEIQQRDSALREARDRLEERVEERTRALSSEMAERERAAAALEDAHKQLVEASRQAGMAEVATGVLHNVGNVLNSINVSATVISDQLKKSRATDLTRVVELLRQNASDLGAFLTHDPKGQKVPAYLEQLAARFNEEQRAQIEELESLRSNIDHVKDIVAMQQSYARVSGVTDTLNVTSLVEDSLRLNSGALLRHGVQLVREFHPVPPVTVEKHKVLQILVNLIRNAKYACDESGRADKQVTLRVANGDNHVRISVIDNGVGIPRENLNRIFAHGFTTRRTGHGFGLHSGALAAKEMGGELKVHSDGPGQGATFTLELPLQPESANAASPAAASN